MQLMLPLSVKRVTQYDQHIAALAKADIAVQRLMQLTGVGPTTATALVSTVGNGHDFKSGRQLSAWLGLVPGQYSSGGKQRLTNESPTCVFHQGPQALRLHQ